jgi:DNA-binding beta-propeller fold protein YncE
VVSGAVKGKVNVGACPAADIAAASRSAPEAPKKRLEGEMPGLRRAGVGAAAAVFVVGLASGAARAQLMIVGNDEKVLFEDGKVVPQPPGKDTLSIIDISKPATPRIMASIPLMNTIAGPPTNLAIHPSGEIALVANSLTPEPDGNSWKNVPSDEVFVVDLKANPPKIIDKVAAGKQASGLAINAKGDMALVANRAAGTVSVLSISGKEVKLVDTVTVGKPEDQVSAVAISPDGKRALAIKTVVDKVAVLTIEGGKVSYDKANDLPANNSPYNVGFIPNGKIALIANTGNGGSSDGNMDTVSVVDTEADPIRIIDHVVVGDSPEGLTISPKGNLAVTVEARGSNKPKSTWYYHPGGAVSVLKIAGKKVTKIGEVTVGKLPEGAVFSADGSYIYVGNFIDSDLSVLRVSGDKVSDTGQRFKLPGHPASMRGGAQ